MKGLSCLRGCTAVLVALSVAPARAATYSAAGDALPGVPFQRFDAAHFGSTFPLSPFFGTGYTPSPDHSVAGGVYSSGSTDQGKYTFWFDSSQTLNSAGIIEVSARVKVMSSTSANPTDRAGVGIALTDNGNRYVEVYLDADEVFLNGSGRTRVGAFALDTTAAFHDYVVRVQGTTVKVLVDGVEQMTGSTFTTSGAPTLPNWAVLGDITSSAAGAYQMQSFAVAVPEPTMIGLLAVAGALAVRRR